MNNLFRGLIAGYGAKKLGGGCFSTILVFVLLWVLLGQCGATFDPNSVPPQDTSNTISVETAPAPVAATELVLAD